MIDSKIIKAAAIFAAKKDIRTYLRGVWLQTREGKTHVLATDGNRMFAHVINWEGDALNVRMSGATLAAVIAAPSFNIVGSSVLLPNGAALPLDSEPGTYPDWRRVVPRELTGEKSNYPLDQIGDIHKAFKALKVPVTMFDFATCGQSAAVVTHQSVPGLIILQMPLRPLKDPMHYYLDAI